MVNEPEHKRPIFTGNIFIFHSFDIGDDILLEKIKKKNPLKHQPIPPSKHFKSYHTPLAITLPDPQSSPRLVSAKLHNFGVVSLRYQIPYSATLEELRAVINDIDRQYEKQSTTDAKAIFNAIKPFIVQPTFFHLRSSYVLIQVNIDPERRDIVSFKHDYGNLITSIVRFETETLSDYQRNEMLAGAIGYYRGDLIVVDTDAAFAYIDEYEELLDIFEFANIQYLELQYYDRVLDTKLNIVYEGGLKAISWRAYLPPFSIPAQKPFAALDRLKVDISVIIDRLENSIKLIGDPYFTELYALLALKLDLASWKASINDKLSIIHDIIKVQQGKVVHGRQDFLSLVIIILIVVEIIVAVVLKKH